MGKGDKRTFRGKIFKGSHGKTRPHHPKKSASVSAPGAKSVATKAAAKKR
jgi:ribosomal small subunit protein bTHX